MKLIKYIVLYSGIVLLSAYTPTGFLEKLSASFISRQVTQGKVATIKGDIYYQMSGVLTSHFSYPKEYILVANKFGESKIYDPSDNTVMLFQNIMFSTQSSQFAYFFSGKKNDMGLSNFGYIQDKTYFEGKLFVSEWKLKKPNLKLPIQTVRLVYDMQKPIYMDYKDNSGKIIRKVYYYNYQKLLNYDFPAVTTEIMYEGKDSTVSKTSYDNIKLNGEAISTYFNFSIPGNAKIIN